eukprot:138800-Rhodomonas_salina.1
MVVSLGEMFSEKRGRGLMVQRKTRRVDGSWFGGVQHNFDFAPLARPKPKTEEGKKEGEKKEEDKMAEKKEGGEEG